MVYALITLSNLQPYSIYNVSVQARTSAGESEPVSVNGTTAESKPEKSPPNVRVKSSTSRSLLFRWDAIPCEHKNGIITHYEYMVLLSMDIYPMHLKLKKRSLDVPVPSSTIHIIEGLEVEIKNLEPDTEYGFMVRGVTKAGAGELSDVLNHKTDEDIPSKPQNLEVISRAAHEIGLYWEQPEVPNGKVNQFQIQFWDHTMSKLAADVVFNVSDDSEEALTTVVKGLAPATDFFISIRASTSAGWGEFSSPISDRTLDGTELDALSPYKVARINDTVELEVNITKKLELPMKWKHNGVSIPSWDNLLKVEIPHAQKEDSGIYECFYEGRRKEGVHAIMRLIVRTCAQEKYGVDCDQDCPPCYNGSVCHQTWGVCVCPAGFTGENCEVDCTAGRFGTNCSSTCHCDDNLTTPCNETFGVCEGDCEAGYMGSDCHTRCCRHHDEPRLLLDNNDDDDDDDDADSDVMLGEMMPMDTEHDDA